MWTNKDVAKILNAVERRRKMDNTSEGNKNLMNKKGATKHCSWGLCNMDSRYPERMKEGVFFIRFAKPGRLKDTMSDWERQQNLKKTEKAKRWLHACGRKDFNRIEQIKILIFVPFILLAKKDLLKNTLIL